MRRNIEFDAEGATLREWFYLPDEAYEISTGAARDWFVKHLITGAATPAGVG